MSDAALHTEGPTRHVRVDAATTTRRWALGVLATATVLLLAYIAFLVAMAWLLASAFDPVAARESVPVGLLAVAADMAPVLLVGWCTGLATSVALARGEALGPRTAGVVAGAVGTTAGAAVLALNGLL